MTERSEHKIALRAEMRALRREISFDADGRARRSVAIWSNVLAAVEDRVGGRHGSLEVMMFDSLPTEPETRSWQRDASVRGWTVRVPEVDGDALRVVPGDVDPALLDVVLVPGLAFTPDGLRLGQGGGHYDRFLSRLAPRCLTIGVCYHEQVVTEIPTEPHDVHVDLVITDLE